MRRANTKGGLKPENAQRAHSPQFAAGSFNGRDLGNSFVILDTQPFFSYSPSLVKQVLITSRRPQE